RYPRSAGYPSPASGPIVLAKVRRDSLAGPLTRLPDREHVRRRICARDWIPDARATETGPRAVGREGRRHELEEPGRAGSVVGVRIEARLALADAQEPARVDPEAVRGGCDDRLDVAAAVGAHGEGLRRRERLRADVTDLGHGLCEMHGDDQRARLLHTVRQPD